MDKKLLEKPENYYNREMSWLQFNYRILNEAKDKSIPLFERLNFLSITYISCQHRPCREPW